MAPRKKRSQTQPKRPGTTTSPRSAAQAATATPKKMDWGDVKNHPVAVVAVAMAATFGATYNWAFPVFAAAQVEKIRVLEIDRDAAKRRADQLAVEVQMVTRERDDAVYRAREIAAESPFRDGEPFPLGLRDIVIGDTEEAFLRRYPGAEYSKLRSYASVKALNTGLFREATYYFGDAVPGKRHVTNVLYFFASQPENPANFDQARGVVLDKLRHQFGEPVDFTQPQTGDTYKRWAINTYVLDVQDSTLAIRGTCATVSQLKRAKKADMSREIVCGPNWSVR